MVFPAEQENALNTDYICEPLWRIGLQVLDDSITKVPLKNWQKHLR